MTDTWVPAPPQPPPGPPPPGLPPANAWSPTTPCASGDSPSIVDGVVITGVPATISAPYAWSITLNDGNAPPNFSVNRNDGSNNLIDQPVQISGANGQITFPNAIFVNGMQADGNLFINGVMQFSALENLQLPGGTAGQVLTATGVAGFLGWASPAIAADAPSNGNLYGRSNGGWSSGGIFTSPLYIQGANSFALVAPAGNQRSILAGSGTAPSPVTWRWQMILGDQTPESGGNAGANFTLLPFSDAGSALSPALTINRATGSATLQGPTQILAPVANTPSLGIVKPGSAGGVAMIAGQSSLGLPRWQLYLGDYVAELGSNFGSDFRISNYTDAGVAIGTPLLINRASGNVTFGYGVTITGALVGGNAQFTGQLVLSSGPSQFVLSGGAAGDLLTTNGLGGLFWAPPAGAPGGSVPEAPVDGTSYARNDAGWVHLTHTDITDWAATLAPYALLTNVPPASTSPPIMDGAASPGSAANFSRGDHIHPSDTSRMPVSGGIFTGGVQFNVGGIFPAAAQLVVGGGTNGQALITNGSSVLSWAGPYYAASNPSGYQTAAQVAAVLPPASTVVPLIDGVGAVGTSAAYARADHVHPVVYMGDNRIINGDMRIDQRNNGASGTAINIYTIDRWRFGATQTGKGTWGQTPTSNVLPGYPYCLGFGSSSAYPPLAGDTFYFNQTIEADFVSDFAWGTASAQPVTLSFWAYSSLTGMFSGSIQNAAATRSYPFTYSIPAANTWTKIAITIPGDAAGTWVMSGNGASVLVVFELGGGATYRAASGAWASGSYYGVTGAVSVVATNAAFLRVTGVKLEIGSVATPFNRQSLAKSLSDCQRYYQHLSQVLIWTGYQGAGMGIYNSLTLLNTMRATPTINLINIGNVNNCTGASAVAQDASNFYAFATTIAAGAANYEADFVFAAEL